MEECAWTVFESARGIMVILSRSEIQSYSKQPYFRLSILNMFLAQPCQLESAVGKMRPELGLTPDGVWSVLVVMCRARMVAGAPSDDRQCNNGDSTQDLQEAPNCDQRSRR